MGGEWLKVGFSQACREGLSEEETFDPGLNTEMGKSIPTREVCAKALGQSCAWCL